MEPFDAVRFDVAGMRFAIAAGAVREVLRAAAVTPLPDAPAVVTGALDVRGRVLPVLDLRPRFRLPSPPVRADELLLRVGTRNGEVLLRADRVPGLQRVERSDAVDVPTADGTPERRTGLSAAPDGLLIVCDPEALLGSDEALALETALERRSREPFAP